MAKTVELEMAAAPVAFVNGEYFRGMCEIAAAAQTQTPIYVSNETQGLFESLYMKRIFGRKQLANGSWIVGNFEIAKNRYLFEYNKATQSYGAKKEDNYNKFIEIVKDVIANGNYTVFSTEPAKESKTLTLADILG